MAKGGRTRGRPRLSDDTAKRAAFNTRVRTALKQSLEAAAEREGRSLSEEIEFRLERSLDEERNLVGALELGFGQTVAAIMLAIGHIMKETARRSDWLLDPEAFRDTVEGVNLLLAILDPDGNPEDWARLQKAFDNYDASHAEMIASALAGAIADPEQEELADFGPLISVIRNWLGAALIARLRERLGLPPHVSARRR